MAISDTWTLPAEAGNLDLDAGNTLGETQWDQLVSDVLYLYNHGPQGLTFTTFTPTVTQVGSLTVTVNRAAYVIVGKIAHVTLWLSIASGTGTAGNAIVIGNLPAALAPAATAGNNNPVGIAWATDSGTANYPSCTVVFVTSTTLNLVDPNTASVQGVAPSWALAAADILRAVLSYEVG